MCAGGERDFGVCMSAPGTAPGGCVAWLAWYTNSMRSADLQQGIQQVVAQVVALARPRRVILFGSAAEGRVGPDSDLDFLVVVPDGRDIGQVTDQLNIGVRARPMPCDFLVVTPSILRRNQHKPGMVYGEILEHGREVYAG